MGDFERTYGAGADFDRIIDENNSEYFRDERQKLKIRKRILFFKMLWFGRKLILVKR